MVPYLTTRQFRLHDVATVEDEVGSVDLRHRGRRQAERRGVDERAVAHMGVGEDHDPHQLSEPREFPAVPRNRSRLQVASANPAMGGLVTQPLGAEGAGVLTGRQIWDHRP